MIAMMKAAPAVMNQPPMTDITPVTRPTALSRPQARSASDVPIPTMKVTYVVERGSLSEVPRAMSSPARTRFTEARTRSKAAPGSIVSSCLLKRESIHVRAFCGTARSRTEPIALLVRTRPRAIRDEPKVSSPSSWRERFTEVLMTFCALLEKKRASVMMTPEPRRKM